jgi:aminoglycoside phosphotransferase (APT) family kinase protein
MAQGCRDDGTRRLTKIADSLETRVRAALASHPQTRALASGPLEQVEGGLSNHAWFAGSGAGACFVRLGAGCAASLGVDRVAECRLLESVADAGIAPRIVLCDPALDLLVTERVPGRTWTRADALEPRNLERLGTVLHSLHRIAARPGWVRVSFASQARRLEGRLAALGVHDRELRALADEAESAVAGRPGAAVACHNDLHHLNILDDGRRLWLVDWEYGGAGDPLFDFASLLCQHPGADGDLERALAAAGAADRETVDRLAAACVLFDYVQWLWYRLAAAEVPDGAGEYAGRAEAIRSRRLAMR